MVQTTTVRRTPNAAQTYRSVYRKNRISFEAAMQSHPTAGPSFSWCDLHGRTAQSLSSGRGGRDWSDVRSPSFENKKGPENARPAFTGASSASLRPAPATHK